MRRVLRESVKSFTAVVLGSLLAGCAWDNSPPPYHTVIRYDPSRSQTFLSNNPSTNTPSTRDWKTNGLVGVGYGTTGSSTAAGGSVGAASSPSGTSTGGGAGTATTGTSLTPSVGVTPGSGTPGTIVGNPPGTGIIGSSPTPLPSSSSLNTGTSPSVGTGLTPVAPLGTSTLTPSSTPNTIGGLGVTNTSPSTTVPNSTIGQTNLFPGFSRPNP